MRALSKDGAQGLSMSDSALTDNDAPLSRGYRYSVYSPSGTNMF